MRSIYSSLKICLIFSVAITLFSCDDKEEDKGGGPNIISYPTCPDSNHFLPHWIDLGLPSGTLWSCSNLQNFDSPEKNMFLWGYGSLNGKQEYRDDGNSLSDEILRSLGNDISESSFDVVHTLNSIAHIPTASQWQELKDNCQIQSSTRNGVNGVLVVGKNGGQLFLPAAGWFDKKKEDEGYVGKYWSSTRYGTSSNPIEAYGVSFHDGSFFIDHERYDVGRAMRAVIGNCATTEITITPQPGGDDGGNSGGGGQQGEPPRVLDFDFTASKTSITVKFMCTERPKSATVKFGKNSPVSIVTSSIAAKQVTARVKGLESGTKYYFRCTVSNDYGSTTSDIFPAITNY